MLVISIGSLVVLTEVSSRKPKAWVIRIEKNGEKSTHLGRIDHNNLIGLDYGQTIDLINGKIVLLKPSPRDFLKSFKLKTQILYEDDCALICSIAGLGNGMRVGEAGTGSGALTCFLAWTVAPTGHVYSFDNNEKHLLNATANIELTNLSKYVTFSVKDIIEPIDLKNLDAFILDFAAPYKAINSVEPTIVPGGHLICYTVQWNQVEKTVQAINENPNLSLIETFEINRRNYTVNPEKHIMRPKFREIVYSGILIHAIKTTLDS
jgi:tRNA (adenine57-N1/adenine58-N1)-methyltransferase